MPQSYFKDKSKINHNYFTIIQAGESFLWVKVTGTQTWLKKAVLELPRPYLQSQGILINNGGCRIAEVCSYCIGYLRKTHSS